VLLAAVVAALLLTVTLFARSFKEAQTYVAPLSFVLLIPAIALQFRDLIGAGDAVYWIPVYNVMVLMDDVVKGSATLGRHRHHLAGHARVDRAPAGLRQRLVPARGRAVPDLSARRGRPRGLRRGAAGVRTLRARRRLRRTSVLGIRPRRRLPVRACRRRAFAGAAVELAISRSCGASQSGRSSQAKRQPQLPEAAPGTFMRASGPKPSRSCSGATAVSATEPAPAATAPTPRSRRRAPGSGAPGRAPTSGACAYQPAVVSLSWVPV
jgi:hypothetical protein